MAQDTIDKIISIEFKDSELIEGWVKTSAAISAAKTELEEFKKKGDAGGVARQTQLVKALRTEMTAYTKEIQNNIREEIKLDGSVEGLRASIQKLTAQYNKLSREERKAATGEEYITKIQKMQTELNEANASLLNFRDNVGNYAGRANGFGPLQFQVQQLAREMPSLTMSTQQFFLAISNNVPMFTDELKKARDANKALRAEGKPTVSVFKQVLSSIFSWQTALVVGITLLTAFGKEIGAWIKGLFSADAALSNTAKHMQELNSAIENSRAELIREFNALKDAKKGTAEYAAARKVIEDKYGDYLTNQREEIRNLEDQKAAYDALAGSITATAIAKGLEESNAKAAEEYGKAMDEAFEGVQDKFVAQFGRETGIAYFTEFRAGLDSEIPELKARAQEIYKMFNKIAEDAYTPTLSDGAFSFRKDYSETSNALEKTVNKVRGATDQYSESLSANKIAMQTLMNMYKISTDDVEEQEVEIKDLIKLKEKELATINDEVAATEKEIASRNKRAEAVEKEIKRLRELGRTTEKVRLLTLEEIQAKNQGKNLNKHTKAISDWRKALGKEVAKIDSDIEKAMKDVDKSVADNFKKQVQEQELKFKNRINEARIEGGDLGAAQEMIEIYKEQIALIDKLEAVYREAGETDEQIQARRVAARKGVQQAEQHIADTQAKNTQQSLDGAAKLAGALGNLAEEAGASAGVVAMLGIAEAVAAMGSALHKAFTGSVTVWDGIAGAIAGIASIVAAVNTMKSLNSSAEGEKSKYKYASGGLVTGPGSGTSDSIPAMLSNGEAVMTARAVSDWGAMLSAMNVSSGGNAIQVSNLPQRNDGMRGMQRMMERALMNMPVPVVSVVDINRGQKRVTIQDNLGKLGRKKRA